MIVPVKVLPLNICWIKFVLSRIQRREDHRCHAATEQGEVRVHNYLLKIKTASHSTLLQRWAINFSEDVPPVEQQPGQSMH